MDFIDKLNAMAINIPKQAEFIQTEEATKNAWVMPFINALGYNVFDPMEVVPELTADVGVKKGEKVDYAIMKDGEPIMLIECKCNGCNLDSEHASQLYRYFTVTKARFGVLTNGIIYRFYTDLEESNKMDSKPFFEFNLLDIKEPQVEELKKFTKSSFDMDRIFATANEMKYAREIKRIMAEQLSNPSDEFVKFFTSQVYTGRVTQTIKEQFAEITKRALQQFVSDRISDRLKSVLADEATSAMAKEESEESQSATNGNGSNGEIVTTPDELEAYFIVRAILRESTDIKRVVMRDAVTYCSVLLDDNNRKPICRFRFNTSNKYIGLIGQDKRETKYPIDDIDGIYSYADQIKATVSIYGTE